MGYGDRVLVRPGVVRQERAHAEKGVRAFADGKWACFQYRFRGTNTGPVMSPTGKELAPTAKSIAFPCCVVARMEGGVIAELDEYFDRLEMLTQLGLIPIP